MPIQKIPIIYIPLKEDGTMIHSEPHLCRYSTSDARSGWKPENQLEERKDVIVMTINDMKEVFDSGYFGTFLSFENYLISKGITNE